MFRFSIKMRSSTLHHICTLSVVFYLAMPQVVLDLT